MVTLLTIAGYLAAFVGAIMVVFQLYIPGIVVLVQGIATVGIARILAIQELLRDRQLGLAPSSATLQLMLRRADITELISSSIELHKPLSGRMELIEVEGQQYVPAGVLVKYLEKEGERFTFTLPGRQPLVLELDRQYATGSKLFNIFDKTMVQLEALGVRATKKLGVAWIELPEQEAGKP